MGGGSNAGWLNVVRRSTPREFPTTGDTWEYRHGAAGGSPLMGDSASPRTYRLSQEERSGSRMVEPGKGGGIHRRAAGVEEKKRNPRDGE